MIDRPVMLINLDLAGEALFTVGRLAGWLAHALEEYADRSALRMRAVCTGARPD